MTIFVWIPPEPEARQSFESKYCTWTEQESVLRLTWNRGNRQAVKGGKSFPQRWLKPLRSSGKWCNIHLNSIPAKTSTLISHCLWIHRGICWQCAGQSGFWQSEGRPWQTCRSWPWVVKLVRTAMVKQSRECGWIDFAMDIAHVPVHLIPKGHLGPVF